MTYRPPALVRWKYPFLLCLCFLGFWAAVEYARDTSRGRGRIFFGLIVISSVGFVRITQRSIVVWSTQVTVDDDGLRWREGLATGELRWNEISGLGHSTAFGWDRHRLVVGPVRASTRELQPLPILPRDLYLELRARLGPLPEEIERDLTFTD